MIVQGSEFVIELAQNFVGLLNGANVAWRKAYFRFAGTPGGFGSTASYENDDGGIFLVGFAGDDRFFQKANDICVNLLRSLDKFSGVVLLVVNSDLSYKVFFEFENIERWRISKMGGGNGLPLDFQGG